MTLCFKWKAGEQVLLIKPKDMTTSKKVMIASDVLYAFVDRTHARHVQASAFFRYFANEEFHIYMDNISIYDCYLQLMNSMSPSIAKECLRSIYISSITIIYPEEADMRGALKFYLNDKSNELNFRKAIMAVLADKNHIPQICSFEYIQSMFGLSLFYIPI